VAIDCQTLLLGQAARLNDIYGQGTPVLLEFQSSCWIACTALKSAVDRLEQELGNRLLIICVDIQGPAGRELTRPTVSSIRQRSSYLTPRATSYGGRLGASIRSWRGHRSS